MNPLRRKLLRVERLRAIDQGVLAGLSAQLLASQTHVQNLRNCCDLWNAQADRLQVAGPAVSISQLCQSAVWLQNVQAQIDTLETRIREAEEQQAQLLERVTEQKSKVRGWDVLIEQLRSRIALELQSHDALAAGDRYLNTVKELKS